ncbi:MAG: M23 family metallopeptidase [Candidatus Hydrogenedentota bacterium]
MIRTFYAAHSHIRVAILAAMLAGVVAACARHEEPIARPATALRPAVVRPSRWPIESLPVITSEFGESRAGGRVHKGLDLAAPTGTPVHATADGEVVFAGWKSGYGHTVILRHSPTIETLYAHLDRILVAVGAPVRQRVRIGLVGASGNATGPHLHYEVRMRGVAVEPRHYLPVYTAEK